jgi:putative membrane protein
MTIPASIMVVPVTLLHFYFLLLEMFFWDKPLGLRTFGIKPESAKASRVLAANQGLYKVFFTAGLVRCLSPGLDGDSIKIFF